MAACTRSVMPPRVEEVGLSLLELGVRVATAAEDVKQRYGVSGDETGPRVA